jgi:hypothetical protein
LDIAIVPGIDPETKLSSTFSLVFDKPASDSLVVAPGTPTSGVTASATPTTAFGSSGAGTGAAAASTPTIPYQAPAVATATPAVSSDKVQPAAPAPSQVPTGTKAAAEKKDRNKTPGYIVLAFAAAVGLYAFRQDNLMALNGGSLPGAPDAPGGLGRFARPRSGVPPALT